MTGISLMTHFQDSPGMQHQECRIILDFNEPRDDKVAMASAGPYTDYLRFIPHRFMSLKFNEQNILSNA